MRIIKIAAVLLFAIAVFVSVMLFGTGTQGDQGGRGGISGGMVDNVPSDGEIIAAIKARWTTEDNEKLAALKKDLATALEECVEFRAQCHNATSLGWCFSDRYDENCMSQVGCPLYCQKTRDACVQRAYKFCDDITKFADQKAEITNFKYRETSQYVIAIAKTNNY